MDMIKSIFSEKFFIYWVEGITIIAVLVVVGFFFYGLNLFKKD